MSQSLMLFGETYMFSHCIECGVGYIVPYSMWKQQAEQGGTHQCINGHSQGWIKGQNTEIDKIRRERDRLKQNEAYLHDKIREQKERKEEAQRRASAMKGVVTRTKNRVGAGICPCCNRSFASLAKHMAHKHPEYRKEGVS